jgi:LysM repeat protein
MIPQEPDKSSGTVATPLAGVTPAPPIFSRTTYTVQSGDTIVAIAKQTGSTVKAIAAANPILDPRQLIIGQVLVIPEVNSTNAALGLLNAPN